MSLYRIQNPLGMFKSAIAELCSGSSTTNFLRIHHADFHSTCTVFIPVNCEIGALLSTKSHHQVLFFVFLILATCTGAWRKLKAVLICKKKKRLYSALWGRTVINIVTHLWTMWGSIMTGIGIVSHFLIDAVVVWMIQGNHSLYDWV